VTAVETRPLGFSKDTWMPRLDAFVQLSEYMSLNNSQEMKFLKSLGGSLNQLKITSSV